MIYGISGIWIKIQRERTNERTKTALTSNSNRIWNVVTFVYGCKSFRHSHQFSLMRLFVNFKAIPFPLYCPPIPSLSPINCVHFTWIPIRIFVQSLLSNFLHNYDALHDDDGNDYCVGDTLNSIFDIFRRQTHVEISNQMR